MTRPAPHNCRCFTLIELMIAMAVLVIMMGFLFQFTISAQRLWSASNNNDIVFEQAQLCFDFLEKDLKAAIVQDEITNPGRAIPYYAYTSALDGKTALPLLCLITQVDSNQSVLDSTNGSAAFPVVYYTDEKNNLYRRVFDTAIGTPTAKQPLFVFGLPVANFPSYITDITTTEFLPQTSEYRLCENITLVKLDFHPDDYDILKPFVLPKVVKITLELMDPSGAQQVSNTNPEVKTRIFSKTIFLR